MLNGMYKIALIGNEFLPAVCVQ